MNGISPVPPGPRVEEVAAAALWADTGDSGDAALVVRRLAAPPEGRRWTALATPGLDGVVFASLKDDIGHIDLIAVDPAAQGRGIGRALLGAAEEWLRAEGATEARFAGNSPCYGWPGIDVRYTPAVCLAEGREYERYNVAWNMTVDLPAPAAGEEAD